MIDRMGGIYDVVKFAYAETEQQIKDNIANLMEREIVICTGNNSMYIKLNNKLFKTELQEVI